MVSSIANSLMMLSKHPLLSVLLIHCLVFPLPSFFYPHHSKFRKLQKLLLTSELCCKHTRDPLCHFKMAPLHEYRHRNDPHHRNDTGRHCRKDPLNVRNGIKRTTKTGQQFSARFLFIYVTSFLRCVIYILPHFILL